MNEISVFENNSFGQVRTLVRDGSPWFVAADVCKALDIANHKDAISRLDDDEKSGVVLTDPHGREQITNCINEPGLYSLILGSRKPEAKAFKRWITHEVIPSIRQTGQYTAPADGEKVRIQSMRAEAMLHNAKSRQASLWVKFADMLDEPAHKQLCASYGTKILAGHEVIALPQVEKTYSATEVGSMYGISSQMVGRIANMNGLKTEEYGRYVLDKSRHSNKEVETFRYNQKGAEAIGRLAGEIK